MFRGWTLYSYYITLYKINFREDVMAEHVMHKKETKKAPKKTLKEKRDDKKTKKKNKES
jgi:hypothetical protein